MFRAHTLWKGEWLYVVRQWIAVVPCCISGMLLALDWTLSRDTSSLAESLLQRGSGLHVCSVQFLASPRWFTCRERDAEKSAAASVSLACVIGATLLRCYTPFQHYNVCFILRIFAPTRSKRKREKRTTATWEKRRTPLYKVVHNGMAVFSSSQCLLSHNPFFFFCFSSYKDHGIFLYTTTPHCGSQLLLYIYSIYVRWPWLFSFSLSLSSALIVSADSIAQKYQCEMYCEISAELLSCTRRLLTSVRLRQ